MHGYNFINLAFTVHGITKNANGRIILNKSFLLSSSQCRELNVNTHFLFYVYLMNITAASIIQIYSCLLEQFAVGGVTTLFESLSDNMILRFLP